MQRLTDDEYAVHVGGAHAFNACEKVFTYVALASGGREANPVLLWTILKIGLVPGLLVGGVISAIAIWVISMKAREHHDWLVRVVFWVFFAVAVWNAVVILRQ